MKSDKRIEVRLFRHPFKDDVEVFDLKCKTYREIYVELGLHLPIEFYIFLDGDVTVKQYSKIPKSDTLHIRATMAGDLGGGSDKEDEGKDLMTVGGIFTFVFFTLNPVFAIIGAVTFLTGLYIYTRPGEAGYTDASGSQAPSISGGSNASRNNEKFPVLLGRHLVFPWYAGLPYASYPDITTDSSMSAATKNQYVNMLMGTSYATATPHIGSIQLGDTPFSLLQEDDPDYALIDFQENDSLPLYYPIRIKQEDCNTNIKRGDTSEYSSPIPYVKTSSTKTYKVDFILTFTNGLFQAKEDERVAIGRTFYIYWKHIGADDSTYVGINDGDPTVYVSGNRDATCRHLVTKTFDNNTPTSSEYNKTRQYVFKIMRVTEDDSDSSIQDSSWKRNSTTYLEAIKSYVGTFDDVNDPETWPILASDKERLNVASLRVKATDVLNGTIQNLNLEMTAHMPVFTGGDLDSGSAFWSYGASRNPACAFMYLLTNENVNQEAIPEAKWEDKIDYASVEKWYRFCEEYDLQCNAYLVSDMTLEAALAGVCGTSFASWNVVDNKYTVYIDTYNPVVSQLFTPRNSWEYSGSKAFGDLPTGMAVTFVNCDREDDTAETDASDGAFVEEVQTVYYDGYTGETRSTDTISKLATFGAMPSEQAWRLGMYSLALVRLRPEVHTFSIDAEHLMCNRWDRIRLQHDAALAGLTSGRVIAPVESAGNTLGFTSDEIISYETGLSYGIQIRMRDGSVVTHTVQNLGTDSRSVLLDTPLAGTDLIFEDDLFAFGEAGTETLDLLILNIETGDDLTATLTCVDYNEAVYEAWMVESAAIPSYVSNVSKGASGINPLTVNELPSSQDEANEANIESITSASKVDYRISAISAIGYAVNTVTSFYPAVKENLEVTDETIYVNYDDNNTIYTGLVSQTAAGTKLNEVSSKWPRYYNSNTQILYINVEDSNSLYLKSATVNELGTKINSTMIDNFAIEPITGDIYIYTATNTYRLDASDSWNVIGTYTTSLENVSIDASGNIYYIKISDGFVYKTDLTFSTETLFFDGDSCVQLDWNESLARLYMLQSTDLYVYYKEAADVDTSTSVRIEFGMAAAGSFVTTSVGNVLYVNNQAQALYYTNLDYKIYQPSMAGEEFLKIFSGDLTLSSEIVVNVSIDTLATLSVGDDVYGSSIPTGAKISLLGNTYFTMTLSAIASETSASITVSGSRLLLRGNKVIVEGTITAPLLEASAISSKQKDVNGDSISDFDLDEGTIILRKEDGTEVLDFDPSRTDEELKLSGTMQSKDFVTGEGGSGWKIDNAGDAEFSNLTVREALLVGGESVGHSVMEPLYQNFEQVGVSVNIPVDSANITEPIVSVAMNDTCVIMAFYNANTNTFSQFYYIDMDFEGGSRTFVQLQTSVFPECIVKGMTRLSPTSFAYVGIDTSGACIMGAIGFNFEVDPTYGTYSAWDIGTPLLFSSTYDITTYGASDYPMYNVYGISANTATRVSFLAQHKDAASTDSGLYMYTVELISDVWVGTHIQSTAIYTNFDVGTTDDLLDASILYMSSSIAMCTYLHKTTTSGVNVHTRRELIYYSNLAIPFAVSRNLETIDTFANHTGTSLFPISSSYYGWSFNRDGQNSGVYGRYYVEDFITEVVSDISWQDSPYTEGSLVSGVLEFLCCAPNLYFFIDGVDNIVKQYKLVKFNSASSLQLSNSQEEI